MNKMIKFRVMAYLFIAMGTVGLLSCSHKQAGADTTNAQSTTQQDAGQREIEKYNHYIDAANQLSMSMSFAGGLKHYEKYYVPDLASQEPLKFFDVVNDNDIDIIKKSLDAALAMSPAMPELDQSAKEYAQALGRLAPLSHELADYAKTKAFLSDNGAKARAQGPAYLAALRDTAKAESAFSAAVAKQDLLNVKKYFDKQQQGTIAYFRAGLLYHAKLTMAAGDTFFSDPNDAQAQATFKTNLDQTNDMVTGLKEKVQSISKDSNQGNSLDLCYSTASEFIATGRESLADAKNGYYIPEKTDPKNPPEVNRTIEFNNKEKKEHDREGYFDEVFTNLINMFNQKRC